MTSILEDLLQRRPYNAATDFVDANVARGRGDKVAFTDPERSLTYAQLQANSYRFAAALKALGLREENRVVLAFHDTVDYPVAFWGAIGGRICTRSSSLGRARGSGCRACICSRICWQAPSQRRSPRRRCRTRSRCGCTRRAPLVSPRRSGTFIPA